MAGMIVRWFGMFLVVGTKLLKRNDVLGLFTPSALTDSVSIHIFGVGKRTPGRWYPYTRAADAVQHRTENGEAADVVQEAHFNDRQ